MVILVWVGLFPLGQVLAQDVSGPGPMGDRPLETIPPVPAGAPAAPAANPMAPQGAFYGTVQPPGPPAAPTADQGGWIVGEQESPPPDAVFGNAPPAGCDVCGGVCTPPPWSFENDIRLMVRSRARPAVIAIRTVNTPHYTLLNASETDIDLQTYQITNQTNRAAVPLDTHNLNFDIAPEWAFTLSRYLGRDGNQRDHFIEFSYFGLDSWSSHASANGPIIPHYESTTQTGTQVASGTPAPIDAFQDSLVSFFPLVSGAAVVSGANNPSDLTLSEAFNNVGQEMVTYHSNLNNWELNVVVKGHNADDELVLNPNGRWYHQCVSGFYYSYLFGLRAVVIDEKFEWTTSGHQYEAVTDPSTGITTPVAVAASSGRYVIRTENGLLGLQAGGNVEYRWCKWSFDIHGKAGPYVNIAEEDTHVQARSTDPLANPDFDREAAARRNCCSVLGEFGFGMTNRLSPNWTARASYDFMWIGDLALAPTQIVLQTNPAEKIKTSGSTFFNGLTLGLEYDW
jgi:hypothetical protein